MGFKEKYFGNNKERRTPYRGSKRFDCSCRNNGSCGYCRDNRLYNSKKKKEKTKDQLKDE